VGLGSFAQNAVIQGIIVDQDQLPLEGINVTLEGTNVGTVSDPDGFYKLNVPAGKEISIRFSSLGHRTYIIENIVIKKGVPLEFNPVLEVKINEIKPIVVRQISDQEFQGVTTISNQLTLIHP